MTTLVLLVLGLATLICMAYVIVRLIEQRDEVTACWADEVFISSALSAKLAQRDRDFAAVTAHLGEVLRDHAECPVPVTPDPEPVDCVWLELLVTRPVGAS